MFEKRVCLLIAVCCSVFGANDAFIDTPSFENDTLVQLILQAKAQIETLQGRLETLERESGNFRDDLYNVTDSMRSCTCPLVSQTQQVAFTIKAMEHIQSPSVSQQLVFNSVITNIGNAYDLQTGFFHCPISGLYLLTGNAIGDQHGNVIFSIVKGQRVFARPYSGTGGNSAAAGSDTVMLHLEKGDVVWLRYDGGTSKYIDKMSMFAGVLIQAD